MRKIFLSGIVFLALISSASAAGIGVGAFGGLSIPVIQEDQGNGTVFGVRGRLKLIPGFTLEPVLAFNQFGDAETDFGTRKGSKVTYYGVDLILGGMGAPVGPRFYLLGGAAFYSFSRDYDEDVTRFGVAGGLGIEIGLGKTLGLDFRGKFHLVTLDGGGSRKMVNITAGINYYLGM